MSSSNQFSILFLVVSMLACFMQTTLAVPAFTAPVAATTDQGGNTLAVKWADNGKSPAYNAQAWGNSTLYLAAGGQNVQFKLQTLAQNVDVKRHQGHYKIDKTIGPNGQYYFIRMEGSQKDATGNPVMAFSARFTLQGMTGTFNSTVMAAATSAQGAATGAVAAAGSSSSSGLAVSKSTSAAALSTSPLSAAAKTSSPATSSAGRLTVLNFNDQSIAMVMISTTAVLATVAMMMVM